MISSPVELTWQEALALTQSIAAASRSSGWRVPEGDVLDEFALDEDGHVSPASPGDAPVSFVDLATFLARLLPRDGAVAGDGQMAPAGLRFALERALGRVEAPAFASLDRFTEALDRYEQGDRRHLLRGVFTKCGVVGQSRIRALDPDAAPTARLERRSSGAGTDVLRRLLRDADRELFMARASQPVAPREARRQGPGADVLRRLLRDEDRRAFELQEAATTRARGGKIVLWQRRSAVAGFAILLLAAGAMAERRPIRSVLQSLGRPGHPSNLARPGDVPRGARDVQAPTEVGTTGVGSFRDVRSGVLAPAAGRDARFLMRPASDSAEGAAPTVTGDADAEPLPAVRSGRLVLAVDVAQQPVFSPSFVGYRAALFEAGGNAGAAADERAGANEHVRVLSIANDRGRNYHPALSPDGQTIAFDSDRDGVRGVYLASRDGRNVRRVSGAEYAAFAAWSPDGDHLAFIRSEPGLATVWNVWSLNVRTGAMARLTSYHAGQPWGVSWFPDSRRICYAHEGEIAVLDTMTGDTWVWASPRADRMPRMPAVSPDGKRVLFELDNDGAWLLELSDGSMREVLADPTAADFAWSPDGRVVFRTPDGWTWWSLQPGS